jgi:catechol 2,3-dioxygenase-like lactoylglutathione lyase family enzyme
VNLVSLRIITDDVARLVEFYEKVTGLNATWSNEFFAEISTSVGTVAIASTRTVSAFAAGSARAADNRSVIIEFLVEDVDSLYAALDGVVQGFVNEPTTMPWGNRSLLIRDPDGNLVNLFTPVTPEAVKKFAR